MCEDDDVLIDDVLTYKPLKRYPVKINLTYTGRIKPRLIGDEMATEEHIGSAGKEKPEVVFERQLKSMLKISAKEYGKPLIMLGVNYATAGKWEDYYFIRMTGDELRCIRASYTTEGGMDEQGEFLFVKEDVDLSSDMSAIGFLEYVIELLKE